MRRVASFTLALLLSTLCAGFVYSHEVRPGYLELIEQKPAEFSVLWKQPVLQDRRLPLEPRLPDGCETLARAAPEHTAAAMIERWQVRCDLRAGELRIDGLSRTLTDVMLSIQYLEGETVRLLLKPDAPAFDLTDDSPGFVSYLVLGIEHLLYGIDHVLFVVLLVFYVRGPWALLKTVTAFTLAHSLTLSAAVLDWIRLPQGPVEAIIALSILYLARELMLPEARRSPLTRSSPWLMAFCFGLLHGFGFAGALAEIGLPRDTLWLALLLFNIGVELGQLLLIVGILLGAWLLRRLLPVLTAPAMEANGTPATAPTALPLFCIGAVAGYWTIDRCLPLLL